ncbi:hypothetical protein ZIOFF_056097 [Zingiber officinale]|uniref:Uncharacterized protein n=1 Tax=Zingiber officinale TaxID=94328 RepID=A0A8J5FIK4_ZINOF|nr:hypothetical protein ZIOFF_056097 [Zingiber officinale]
MAGRLNLSLQVKVGINDPKAMRHFDLWDQQQSAPVGLHKKLLGKRDWQETSEYTAAIEHVLAGLAHLLRQNADTSQVARIEMSYEKFRKMGPPKFTGSTNPLFAEGWVRSLETIFRYMRLEDVARVSSATFQLKDVAALWWEGLKGL